MEGSTGSGQVLDDLEDALKDVTDDHEPLGDRLGPALAALLHSAYATDIGKLHSHLRFRDLKQCLNKKNCSIFLI